jgi:hypothetical protein
MREYGVTIDPSSLSSEQMLIEDGDLAENAGMDGVMSDKVDVRLVLSLGFRSELYHSQTDDTFFSSIGTTNYYTIVTDRRPS